MNEYEIIEHITRINKTSEKIVSGIESAQKEGRMPTMSEAKQMDELSTELLQNIGKLPYNVCDTIVNPQHQQLARQALDQARQTLRKAVHSERPVRSSGNGIPRVAMGRMNPYNNY